MNGRCHITQVIIPSNPFTYLDGKSLSFDVTNYHVATQHLAAEVLFMKNNFSSAEAMKRQQNEILSFVVKHFAS